MTPEEKARVKIDQWFNDAGWKVVNRDEYEPTITAAARMPSFMATKCAAPRRKKKRRL